jgi:predicted DNA-binding protein (UPF0251 family)
MARPQKSRKILNPPKMKGFRPFGMQSREKESLELKYEEYESLRLVNYKMLPQDLAARQMNISRPTFTRIYNKALKLIAKSFVEGKAIKIEGGNYQFDKDWYRCRKCYKLIQGIENHSKCKDCNAYGESELIKLN